MKYTILFLLISMNINAKEVVCLPDPLNAPFDEISLLRPSRGNKYQLKAIKDGQVIYEGEVSYSFLRRGQTAYFKSKNKSIEIKTKRLFTNSVTRSLMKIGPIVDDWIRGVCKLYP